MSRCRFRSSARRGRCESTCQGTFDAIRRLGRRGYSSRNRLARLLGERLPLLECRLGYWESQRPVRCDWYEEGQFTAGGLVFGRGYRHSTACVRAGFVQFA